MQVSATKRKLIRRWRQISAGHDIGVALDVYTKSSIEDRAGLRSSLEESVLTNVIPIRKKFA